MTTLGSLARCLGARNATPGVVSDSLMTVSRAIDGKFRLRADESDLPIAEFALRGHQAA